MLAARLILLWPRRAAVVSPQHVRRFCAAPRSPASAPSTHAGSAADAATGAAAAGSAPVSSTAGGGDATGGSALEFLVSNILMRGPISVADYMKYALRHPDHGYYMRRDVFGTAGDFTTAPEISQMFGELVGVWCVHTWMEMNKPSRIQLLELGPGRGSLMVDLLRAARKFPAFYRALDVCMVEISPALSDIQCKSLQCVDVQRQAAGGELERAAGSGVRRVPPYMSARLPDDGPRVQWFDSVTDVPDGPLLVVAQEFFDAMPVYQFEYTVRGWRERLVDVEPNPNPHHLRFVLAPDPTPASIGLLLGHRDALRDGLRRQRKLQLEQLQGLEQQRQRLGEALQQLEAAEAAEAVGAAQTVARGAHAPAPTPAPAEPASERRKAFGSRRPAVPATPQPSPLAGERVLQPKGEIGDERVGDRVEVAAESVVAMQELARRMSLHGGAALVIDYGNDCAASDSLRAIRNHSFVHLFDSPGDADLSADVDFSALRHAVRKTDPALLVHGPVTQGQFLENMGIRARVSVLLQNTPDEKAQDDIVAAYERLVEGMGSSYKVMAVTSAPVRQPAGFASPDAATT